MGDYETIIHPIDPIYDENSKILILGSFPSVKTRSYGFFYGNKQNRFWKVLEIIFNNPIEDNIESKKEFLHRHNIALWDVIYKCDIIGSSDSSIKNVEITDLRKIFNKAQIKNIYCNGGLSYKLYNKYHKKYLDISAHKLPSTSPANARYSLEDLVENWKIIKEV